MKLGHRIATTLATIAAFGVSTLAAAAATLTLQTEFDVTARSGPDSLGLIGSRVLFEMEFADGTVFTRDGFATPRAVASSASVTVSGASVGSSNGDYTLDSTVGLFSTGTAFDGIKSSGSSTLIFGANRDASTFGILDLVRTVRFDADGTVGIRALGDQLTLAILQGVAFSDRALSGDNATLFSRSADSTNYTLTNFTTSAFSDVAPVPLPAGLPLLLSALGAFAFMRRSKKA